MRSLLFVPADSDRKMEKGLSSGADCLFLDLEDSVAASTKEKARQMACDFLIAHRRFQAAAERQAMAGSGSS